MEPSPEVLAFAQPLAPVEVLAAPGPVAALLSAATGASLEEEVAVAEVALVETVAADGSLSAAFAAADSPVAAPSVVAVAVEAEPAVAAVVSSLAARAEYFAARVGFDFLLAHPGRSVAVVAGD